MLLTRSDLNYLALYENKLILSDELKEFIRLSKREVQKSRSRRRTIAIAAVGTLIVILTGFTIWAFYERNRALEQSNIAEVQKNEALRANEEAESARNEALRDRDRAEESEAVAIEHQQTAEEESENAIRANRAAEAAKQQALDDRNMALKNEKIAQDASIESEKAKEDAIRANNDASFYLYLFNGKELANKSLLMKENRVLKAQLALTAYDLVGYGYEQFSRDASSVRYDIEILQSLQEAYMAFEDDNLLEGEIWDISSNQDMLAYSHSMGKLLLSRLEPQDAMKLPTMETVFDIDLPTNSLVRSVAFNDNGDQLICGSLDGNVTHVDLSASEPSVPALLYNHNQSRVLFLGFVPGREWIISSSTDRTLKVWDMEQQDLLREIQLDENIEEFVIINQELVVYPLSDGRIMAWDPGSDEEPKVLYADASRQPFQAIAYNPEHNMLVTSSPGQLKMFPFDPEISVELITSSGTIEFGQKGVISHLEFSPDNRWLVSAGAEAILLYDLSDTENISVNRYIPLVIENDRMIFSLTFDRDSKYLIYGDNQRLHIHPIDLGDIYSKLKLISGGEPLSQQAWNYYIKGNLERPD